MSIYATAMALDGGEADAPIVYQGSHVLPAKNDARAGSLLLCQIPGHITRDGRELPEGEEYARLWPWLRLSLHAPDGDAAAVLDYAQVQRIHAYLGEWLETADRKAA